jgi:hypothetical protein
VSLLPTVTSVSGINADAGPAASITTSDNSRPTSTARGLRRIGPPLDRQRQCCSTRQSEPWGMPVTPYFRMIKSTHTHRSGCWSCALWPPRDRSRGGGAQGAQAKGDKDPIASDGGLPMADPVPVQAVVVRVAVHQPSPDSTLAVSLDSAPDLSSTNSTQAHWVDVEHQPTDLAVGVFGSLAARQTRRSEAIKQEKLCGPLAVSVLDS